MTGRPIRISIIGDGRQARAELARTSAAAERMSAGFSRAGKLIAGAFAIGTLTRAASELVRVGDAYTSQLAKIKALSTDSDLKQVNGIDGVGKALEKNTGLYAKYGSTVADAAGGVVELVKAGQALPKALKEVNATMVLAAAGEMSVADASSVVATALTTFHLKAKAAGDVANYLANAANISTADVSDLAQALKFVAPMAHSSGVSIQQTAAYLAELSNAGINGTNAGTGLRKVMASLQSPTGAAGKIIARLGLDVFTATGKARPFSAVMDDLGKKLNKLSDEDRKHDLRQIFGLTGITAAQVLLDQGTKGLAQYTKGIELAGAATKLAKANSAGLGGTLRMLKADFISAAQTAYREYSPKVNAALQGGIKWFRANEDEIKSLASAALSRLVPAAKAIVSAVGSWADAFFDVVKSGKSLTPLFGTVVDGITALAKLLGSVPDGVKKLAIEIGLAALAFKALNAVSATIGSRFVTPVVGGMSTARASIATFRTDLAAMSTEFSRLGAVRSTMLSFASGTSQAALRVRAALSQMAGAAKMAAGIGGMLALTSAMQESSQSAGVLKGALGGALTGFAVSGGNPLGLLVGGVGGGLLGLFTSKSNEAKAAQERMAQAAQAAQAAIAAEKAKVQEIVQSLNQWTTAVTAQTKRTVWDQLINDPAANQILTQFNKIGVSSRELINGMVGIPGAGAKVNAALQGMLTRAAALQVGADKLGTRIQALQDKITNSAGDTRHSAQVQNQAWQQQIGILSQRQAKMQAQADAIHRATDAYDQMTGRVKSSRKSLLEEILAVGNVRRALGATNKQWQSWPKRLRTRLTNNFPETESQIFKLARQIKLTPKQIKMIAKLTGVDLTKRQIEGLSQSFQKVPRDAEPALKKLPDIAKTQANNMRQQVQEAQPGFIATVKATASKATSGAQGTARSGGQAIGAALDGGMVAGIYASSGAVMAAANALAARAAAAIRAPLGIHSPSRVTTQYGRYVAQGLANGIKKDTPKVATAAQRVIKRLLAQFSSANIKSALGNFSSLLGDLIDTLPKDKQKHAKALRAAVLKSTKDERAELEKIAQRQTANVKALEKAKSNLQAIKGFYQGIADNVKSFTDVTQFGADPETGVVTFAGIISGMQTAVVQTQKWASAITKLRKMGINKTTLQQLINAGPSSYAVAQAILAAGKSGVAQVNSLATSANSAALSLGNSTATAFYSSGLQAAQGLVNGLEAKAAKIRKAAHRLAQAMVAEIKKALGIHSPSRVFADLGRYSVEGLRIGLDTKPVREQGQHLAKSLISGFGTPALDAIAKTGGVQQQGQHLTATITLTAQQVDQLSRGQQIQADLDAWKTFGGRQLAKAGR